MRTALVVFDPPGLDQPPRLGQRLEPVDVQAFVAQRAVERLDKRVVRRLAWSREVDPGSVVVRPQINEMTSELRAIVGKQIFGRPAAGERGGSERPRRVRRAAVAQPRPPMPSRLNTSINRQRAELLAVAELRRG